MLALIFTGCGCSNKKKTVKEKELDFSGFVIGAFPEQVYVESKKVNVESVISTSAFVELSVGDIEVPDGKIASMKINLFYEDSTMYTSLDLSPKAKQQLNESLGLGKDHKMSLEFKSYDYLYSTLCYFVLETYFEDKPLSKMEQERLKEERKKKRQSKNIDRILDEYEKYLDKMVELTDKMNKGQNVAKEYSSILESISKISEEVENLENSSMSEEQAKRVLEIHNRMLSLF